MFLIHMELLIISCALTIGLHYSTNLRISREFAVGFAGAIFDGKKVQLQTLVESWHCHIRAPPQSVPLVVLVLRLTQEAWYRLILG